jgi:ankyrin repeat protein
MKTTLVCHDDDGAKSKRIEILLAARHGRTEEFMALVPSGAYIDSCSDETALTLAAYGGNTVTVRAILRAGVSAAHINRTDAEGKTALMWAAFRSHTETAVAMLQASVDADIVSSDTMRCTALMWAASQGHVHTAVCMVNKGANVNFAVDGVTALHWAHVCSSPDGCMDTAVALVQLGADTSSFDAETRRMWTEYAAGVAAQAPRGMDICTALVRAAAGKADTDDRNHMRQIRKG